MEARDPQDLLQEWQAIATRRHETILEMRGTLTAQNRELARLKCRCVELENELAALHESWWSKLRRWFGGEGY